MSVAEVRKIYGDIHLLDVEAEAPYHWDLGDSTHVRVCLPASAENQEVMCRQGFRWVDRTLDASIRLKGSKTDFRSLVRLQPVLEGESREAVRTIALDSFPEDRRFHITPQLSRQVAALALNVWVDELEEWYLCTVKGEAAGFLALRPVNERSVFVHLAAVAERYRIAGVAMSLYANAAADCEERGFRTLDGRISSANTAVMNLYSYLGAAFSNPLDVYLKEV